MSAKILVLDDDDDGCVILREYLEDRGHSVHSVHNAAEARSLASAETFHLAILDIMLPDGDGLEVLTHFRATHPKVPVLMLTGLGYEEDLIKGALDKGAAGYMSKRLPFSQLLMEIHRILGEHRTAAA